MQRYGIETNSSIKGLREWVSNDRFIIEQALTHIKDKKLQIKFNKVHMYLKVATISDIITADGKYIAKDIFNVEDTGLSVTSSATVYIWL